MKSKSPRGGSREGAGRPKGVPRAKLQITLPEPLVARMDSERGTVPRSEWIERKLATKTKTA